MYYLTLGLTAAYRKYSCDPEHKIESMFCSKLLCGVKKGWDFKIAFEKPASSDPSAFTETQFLILASLLHPMQRNLQLIPKEHHMNAKAALRCLVKWIYRKLHPEDVTQVRKSLGPTSDAHDEQNEFDFFGNIDRPSYSKPLTPIDPVHHQVDVYLDNDIRMKDFQDRDGADSVSKFDLLQVWKAYAVLNKPLAETVRVILAIPASTIPSESSFSILQLIVDRLKSRRLPSLVDDLAVSFFPRQVLRSHKFRSPP